jgi:hypothetical protein
MIAGALIRPSPGKPSKEFTRAAPTGGAQNSAPTVGFAEPPHGTCALPATATASPRASLPGKHGRGRCMQV